ncbi:uncharacterized protein ACLA_017130 [Aspergillus clavatus NRRL 1]|uniref:BTB domain-containing protein n=1 Tax=Aspergillus clavatus (strain ATCC 1007 / CBS 513.65 / DSM 816 / NCTC 3887 / NRRL 1 / QM 1276 / 107) TaxID=344612 RepID=A1CBZ8_ASPCL|nr:uncharacterized protein ACLA_017130 [Aspergillus clavatus NRRL 1]EAW13266.1 conserved hypothetical protein [Aspergillus clavatus NRRL 1]
MDQRTYELDPKGDVVFLLYDVPHSLLHSLDETPSTSTSTSPAQSIPADNEDTPTLLRIRASSKHLTLACPQIERSLSNGFSEAKQLRATGHVEVDIDNWDAAAFLCLMMIIHGRTRAVPRRVSIDELVEMAVLVDYYECYEAVEVFTEMWMEALKRKPMAGVEDAEKWLFVAWVFQQQEMFANAGVYLQKRLRGRFDTSLPVPRRVRDAVDNARETAIESILDLLHNRLAGLQSDEVQCSYDCDCALLGALTKHMHRLGLLPRPPSPFPGLGLEQLARDCPNVPLPRWYERASGVHHSCLVTLGFNQSLQQTPSYRGKFDLADLTQVRNK